MTLRIIKKSCHNKNVLLINIVVETHTLRIMYWITAW